MQTRPLRDTVTDWPNRLSDEEAAPELELPRRHARTGRPQTQEEISIVFSELPHRRAILGVLLALTALSSAWAGVFLSWLLVIPFLVVGLYFVIRRRWALLGAIVLFSPFVFWVGSAVEDYMRADLLINGSTDEQLAIDQALSRLVHGCVSMSFNTPWAPSLDHGSTVHIPLLKAGSQDIPYLIRRMDSGDLRVKMYCASALGDIGDPRAVRPLLALLEEMQAGTTGTRGEFYGRWCQAWGDLYWRCAVREAATHALSKFKDPAISTYALQKLLATLAARDSGDGLPFLVQGRTWCGLLKSQEVEDDIRRAIGELEDWHKKIADANIVGDLKVLRTGKDDMESP